jgi:hypothetical protein
LNIPRAEKGGRVRSLARYTSTSGSHSEAGVALPVQRPDNEADGRRFSAAHVANACHGVQRPHRSDCICADLHAAAVTRSECQNTILVTAVALLGDGSSAVPAVGPQTGSNAIRKYERHRCNGASHKTLHVHPEIEKGTSKRPLLQVRSSLPHAPEFLKSPIFTPGHPLSPVARDHDRVAAGSIVSNRLGHAWLRLRRDEALLLAHAGESTDPAVQPKKTKSPTASGPDLQAEFVASCAS